MHDKEYILGLVTQWHDGLISFVELLTTLVLVESRRETDRANQAIYKVRN